MSYIFRSNYLKHGQIFFIELSILCPILRYFRKKFIGFINEFFFFRLKIIVYNISLKAVIEKYSRSIILFSARCLLFAAFRNMSLSNFCLAKILLKIFSDIFFNYIFDCLSNISSVLSTIHWHFFQLCVHIFRYFLSIFHKLF